jgi:hypothetical protein
MQARAVGVTDTQANQWTWYRGIAALILPNRAMGQADDPSSVMSVDEVIG